MRVQQVNALANTQVDYSRIQERSSLFRMIDQWLVDKAERHGVSCWEAVRAVALGLPIWSERLPTAGVRVTSTKNILFYFNPTFFDSMFAKRDENDRFHLRRGLNFLCFVVLHELYHVILRHTDPKRRGDRNTQVWNAACDVVDNEFLLHKYGWQAFFEKAEDMDPYWTLDRCYTDGSVPKFYDDPAFGQPYSHRVDWTVEQIYELIMQNPDLVTTCVLVDVMPGEPGENGMVGGSGDPQDQDEGEEQKGSGSDQKDDGGSGKDDQGAIDEIIADLSEDAKARNSMAGNSDQFTEWASLRPERKVLPHVPWQKVLYDFVNRSLVNLDASNWCRPPRKLAAFYPEVILPGDDENVIRGQKVAVFLDVSSSMSRELIQELVGLIHELPRNAAQFVYYLFNHSVHSISEQDILSGKFHIGGGTSFHAIEAECQTFDSYPDVVIVLSDGEAGIPEIQAPMNWCWAIAGSAAQFHKGDYGKVIELPAL